MLVEQGPARGCTSGGGINGERIGGGDLRLGKLILGMNCVAREEAICGQKNRVEELMSVGSALPRLDHRQ